MFPTFNIHSQVSTLKSQFSQLVRSIIKDVTKLQISIIFIAYKNVKPYLSSFLLKFKC